MKQVYFKIPGTPMAKQRHRTTKQGRAYTPDQTVNYENLIKLTYQNIGKKVFWDCEPLSVAILAVFMIPKSYSKKKVKQCLKGELAPSTKDCDNIAKIVMDALNTIAYTDDKHVCEIYVCKRYTDNPDYVGVHVELKDFKLPDQKESGEWRVAKCLN
jgi:Holliday junction resolvase RusA-like endonuclease